MTEKECEACRRVDASVEGWARGSQFVADTHHAALSALRTERDALRAVIHKPYWRDDGSDWVRVPRWYWDRILKASGEEQARRALEGSAP